jgi:hypothetical protein
LRERDFPLDWGLKLKRSHGMQRGIIRTFPDEVGSAGKESMPRSNLDLPLQ